MHHKIVVKSPINIALVKYWGKENEDFIIPCNSSVSITLDLNTIYTKTTVTFNDQQATDHLELNGKVTKISTRTNRCIQMLRDLLEPNSPYRQRNIFIRSENNFPTAAGMASSASVFLHLFMLFGNYLNWTAKFQSAN